MEIPAENALMIHPLLSIALHCIQVGSFAFCLTTYRSIIRDAYQRLQIISRILGIKRHIYLHKKSPDAVAIITQC